MQGSDPRVSGYVSPDGLWRWDGVRWVAVASATPPPPVATFAPPPATFGSVPAAAVSGPPRSRLATGGGITAIIAVGVIIAGCIVPYAHYSDASGGSSPSVFNGGFPGAWGNAAEPVLVILFALAAAMTLIVLKNRTARAILSGALLAMGAQTFTMFIAYAAAAVGSGQLGAGSVVGFIGSILLFAGGAMSASSLLSPPASS
ncbi:MAG TPA: hypothetical protein VGU71_05495 [Candidatus Dormibacteraeota bacterium]|nr:hypothetical protein [Candidatus Dormibacteraeota bacterium]